MQHAPVCGGESVVNRTGCRIRRRRRMHFWRRANEPRGPLWTPSLPLPVSSAHFYGSKRCDIHLDQHFYHFHVLLRDDTSTQTRVRIGIFRLAVPWEYVGWMIHVSLTSKDCICSCVSSLHIKTFVKTRKINAILRCQKCIVSSPSVNEQVS